MSHYISLSFTQMNEDIVVQIFHCHCSHLWTRLPSQTILITCHDDLLSS